MFSCTTLVCIVDLMCIMCIVDHMCLLACDVWGGIAAVVDHMCRLACNVCGGITAVAFSCYGILHLTLCGSTSGPCMVSELSCHIWEATIVGVPALSVVYICVCWPPKRRVKTITSPLLQHRKYLLLLCCLPYLPSQGVTLLSANVGRHSLCLHCQWYQ